MPTDKPSLFRSFSRSQVSAGLATAVDYGVLFGLAELCGVWYVAATALGALAGAIVNFLVNRHWSFRAQEGALGPQALRYALVSGGSLLLNTAGVWAVTESFKIPYGYSVVGVSLGVAIFFNFPLHRFFVFQRTDLT